MLSPQVDVHTDAFPILLVQVKPGSGTQLMHPVLFPLSHCSAEAVILSPQTTTQVDGPPGLPVQE